MKKFFTLIAFIAFSCVAQAKPEDYPPTAFQLVQIHHYVTKKGEVDGKLNQLYKAREAKALLDEEGSSHQYIRDAEFLMRDLIRDPENTNRTTWEAFVDRLLPVITLNGIRNTISASFLEPSCKEIIVDAIMAEQQAMKQGHVVLWRASGSTANLDRKNTTRVRDIYDGFTLVGQEVAPNHLSFSHGLFSGFIFDGHIHQCSSSYSDTSACTYTYFSAFLYHMRMVKEGAKGFCARLIRAFPDYFRAHKNQISACRKIKSMMDALSFLDPIKEFYRDLNGEGADEITRINEQFMRELALIWELMDGVKTVPEFHLYGLTMAKDELAQKSQEAEETGDPDAIEAADLRGEFFAAEYAVYGRGETFHPKLVFPQEGRFIKLYTYPSVEVVDDNDDD